MSAIDSAAKAPAAAVSFAKNKPLAFAFAVLVIVLLTIRFSQQIGNFLARLPVVGPLFVKVMVPARPAPTPSSGS